MVDRKVVVKPLPVSVGLSAEEQRAIMVEFLDHLGDSACYTKDDIPPVPLDTEGLILVCNLPHPDDPSRICLRRTLIAWWNFFQKSLTEGSQGYTVVNPKFKTKVKYHLRQTPGAERKPGIYWVKFGVKPSLVPTANYKYIGDLWQIPKKKGQELEENEQRHQILSLLAGHEVLVALVYSPGLMVHKRIYMPGIQLRRRNGLWDHTLVFRWQSNAVPKPEVVLSATGAYGAIFHQPFLVEYL